MTQCLNCSAAGSAYAFERQILLERQREGVQIAKQADKYTGRKKIMIPKRSEDSGVWSIHEDSRRTWISLSSVQRAKAARVGNNTSSCWIYLLEVQYFEEMVVG